MASGKELQGKLMALRFKSSDGTSVFGRSRVKSLDIDATWTEERIKDETEPEKPAEPEKTEEETEAGKEKDDALSANRSLSEAAIKKSHEIHKSEEKAVEAKYASPKRTVEPVSSDGAFFPISAVVSPRLCRWKTLIWRKQSPPSDDSIRKSGPRRCSRYSIEVGVSMSRVAQSECPWLVTTLPSRECSAVSNSTEALNQFSLSI